MTTLLKATGFHYPGQKRSGVCNAQCYDAIHDHCTCSCGGINHRVGLEKAIENTKKLRAEGKLDNVEYNDKILGVAVPIEPTGSEVTETILMMGDEATGSSETVVTPTPVVVDNISEKFDEIKDKVMKSIRPRDAKGHFIKVS